jgi:hypothetical protein
MAAPGEPLNCEDFSMFQVINNISVPKSDEKSRENMHLNTDFTAQSYLFLNEICCIYSGNPMLCNRTQI